MAPPGTPQFDAQRLLLLELVVDPPEHGDDLRELARRLELPLGDAEVALVVDPRRARLADRSVGRPEPGGSDLRVPLQGALMSGMDRAVLGFVLEHHPAQLATEEIVRALTERPDEFGPRDEVVVALRDLASVGLVHSHGGFWFATLAAVSFDELERDP